MKCPLLLPIIYQLGGLPDGNEDECKKEECEWWEESLDGCDPSGLATVFIALGNTLGRIADRMPKDLAPGGR